MQTWTARLRLGLVAALLPAPAVAAEPDLVARLTAAVDGAPPCYARSYGTLHLDAHPRQMVESVAVTARSAAPSAEQGRHELLFAVKFKQQPRWYRKAGLCVAEAGQLACRLEGDAGSAVIATLGQKGLRVDTGPKGIGVDGPDGSLVGVGGEVSDDRVFFLHASPRSVCLAASGE
ncbi:MAG: hypothetical protein AB1749_02965 [Pseudomonadota bacterium]